MIIEVVVCFGKTVEERLLLKYCRPALWSCNFCTSHHYVTGSTHRTAVFRLVVSKALEGGKIPAVVCSSIVICIGVSEQDDGLLDRAGM